jgi:hypothetical protein
MHFEPLGDGLSGDGRSGDSMSGDVTADVPLTPVAFDSVTAPSATCAASPCTLSHTVGAGTDGIILIWYFCASGFVGTSAVTSDGVTATKVGQSVHTAQGGELWYATGVAAGAHAISVTHGCPQAYVGTMSALHVDQAMPVRGMVFDGTDVSTLSISDTIASAPSDLVLDGACQGSNIGGASANQTIRYLHNFGGGSACDNFGGSTQPGASPSITDTWTSASSDFWILMGVSLRATGSP